MLLECFLSSKCPVRWTGSPSTLTGSGYKVTDSIWILQHRSDPSGKDPWHHSQEDRLCSLHSWFLTAAAFISETPGCSYPVEIICLEWKVAMFGLRSSLRRAQKQDKVTTLKNTPLRTHQPIGAGTACNPLYQDSSVPCPPYWVTARNQVSTWQQSWPPLGWIHDGKQTFSYKRPLPPGTKECYSFEIKNSYSPHLLQATWNVHELPIREMKQFTVHLSYQHKRKGSPVDWPLTHYMMYIKLKTDHNDLENRKIFKN